MKHLTVLAEALDQMAAAFNTADLAALGGLTCSEADAFARVLAVAGHDDAAVNVLMAHAGGDDDSEDHHTDMAHPGVWDQRGELDLNALDAAHRTARQAALHHVRTLIGHPTR